MPQDGHGFDDPVVTSAMIEAGMKEYKGLWLELYDADDDAAREMLTAVYITMYRLRPLAEER